MKNSQIANAAFAIGLIAVSAYEFRTGQVLGRAGLTSLTREANPLVFWTAVPLFTVLGIALLAYSVANMLRIGGRWTAQIDLLAKRLYAARGRVLFVLLGSVTLLLLGSIAWLVVGELAHGGAP